MTHDTGLDPAAPGAPAPARPTGAAAVRTTDGLAEAVSCALEPPVEHAHAIVQDFVQTGRITRQALQQLAVALEDTRTVARQLRQLGDLERLPPMPGIEAQRLDILVSQALARQMAALRRHRVQVQPHAATAIWVMMDAQLLPRLIDAALAWCTRGDHRLTVSLDPSGDLGTVLLRLRVQADVPDAPPDAHRQLAWYVLNVLARVGGARLLCQESGAQTVLTLALPRQLDVAPDPAPGDLLTSQDSLMTSDAVPLQHQRVLLITRHDEVRAEVEHVCTSLGAQLDWVATGAAAVRQFAQARADLVLLDERSTDAATERLQQQLLGEAPDFPWIALTQESSSASLTHWMREDGVTLTNLRTHLASTLLYGLSRARPR